jgi:hypothetical protein
LIAGLAAVSVTGCSHAPPPVTPLAPGLEPWELPAAELGTQRLLRAHYDGPEGEGALRITFRLVSPRRYQALATLALGGRKLWSLEVEGDEGLWIDHRAETWCRLEGRLEMAGGLLTALPFPAFPALLLGRLPEAPAAALKEKGGTVSFRGGGTRRWRAETEHGRVVSWTLWEGARPVAWWERRGAEAILSDRRHQVQLRWREVVREPLTGALEPLTVPAGYRPGSCEGVDFRVDPSSAGG